MEQRGLQLFAGVLRLQRAHRDGHGLAGLGLVQQLDGVRHLKAVACRAVGDFIGVLIADGIDRRGAVAAVELVQIDGGGEGFLHGVLLVEFRRDIGVKQLLIERGDVELAFLGAEGDMDGLVGTGSGVHGAFREGAAVLVGGCLQNGADLLLIHGQIIRSLQIMALGERLDLQL